MSASVGSRNGLPAFTVLLLPEMLRRQALDSVAAGLRRVIALAAPNRTRSHPLIGDEVQRRQRVFIFVIDREQIRAAGARAQPVVVWSVST